MTSHEAMVERLLHASKRAGRDEVARLAYQMARTCLSFAKGDPSNNFRWFEDLRSVSDLRADADRMVSRAGLDVRHADLPVANPTQQSAVDMALACLVLAESIEGGSTRIEFQRAQCVREQGHADEAVDRLTSMLSGPLTKSWYQVTQESLQSGLLKLGRYQDVVDIGRQLLKWDSRRPAAAFNLLTALAWMEMGDAFQESTEVFGVSLVGVQDHGYWSQLIADETGWFALQLKREPSDVMSCLAPPGSLPSFPPRNEP